MIENTLTIGDSEKVVLIQNLYKFERKIEKKFLKKNQIIL